MNFDYVTGAIDYAIIAHKGQTRKGTDIPYITHPVNVGIFLSQLTTDEDVIVSGFLHDVIEDTPITEEDIKTNFNVNVLRLVLSNSEDKSKSWEERKSHTINSIQNCFEDELLLLFADKFCNLKDIYNTYQNIGDAIWSRFNRGQDKQKWYYVNLYREFNKRKDIIPELYLMQFKIFLLEVFGKECKWDEN